MGLSIFYSLSLPALLSAAEVEAKLVALASKARTLSRGTRVKIGDVKKLSAADCGMAQAKMNDDFDFSCCVCHPPGSGRRGTPLGEVPDLAMYFRFSGHREGGINIGLATYKPGTTFRMLGSDGEVEAPYDGRWYLWTFIDMFTGDEARLLESLLTEARDLGFETKFRDESRDLLV